MKHKIEKQGNRLYVSLERAGAGPVRFLFYLFALFASGALVGCTGILDIMGQYEVVKDVENLFKDPVVEDDKIEDKNPQYKSDLWVEEEFDGCTFLLNKSGSVTMLDVVAFSEENEDLETRLFRTRGDALAELFKRRGAEPLPSLEVVNGALKGFNDGLYASIEVGVQQGVEGDEEEVFKSKREFLQTLAARLAEEHENAAGVVRGHLGEGLAHVIGGLLASGEDSESFSGVDNSIVENALNLAAAFEEKVLFSSPISFYTWDDVLIQVFKQDRFFQNKLSMLDEGAHPSVAEVGRFAAIAAVIKDDADLREQYERILALYAGLTNPYNSFSAADLFDYVEGVESLSDVEGIRSDFLAENDYPFVCRGTYMALFPASRSKDSDFFADLFCISPPPEDVTLINVLINGIMDGLVDLTPDPEVSGWYDYQLYALETLLLPNRGPESDHLLLTKAYKEKLIETFKAIITQTRETHAKQLDFPAMGISAPPQKVDIYPKFPVEPFPTFYLRTARGYRFLKTYLQGVLGPEFLSGRGRVNADGSMSEKSLQDEMDDIIRLTYGLYIVTARSVGLDPLDYLMEEETAEFSVEECVEHVKGWLSRWTNNEDILADPRVMVPVGKDQENNQVIYWATLGVRAIEISAEFVEGFEPEIRPGGYSNCEVRDIVSKNYFLLMEEMQEVRIRDNRQPPTRDELREICDSHDNVEDIIAALEAL